MKPMRLLSNKALLPLTTLTFGIYMEKATDAPILLIKTAWGGKILNTDWIGNYHETHPHHPATGAAGRPVRSQH